MRWSLMTGSCLVLGLIIGLVVGNVWPVPSSRQRQHEAEGALIVAFAQGFHVAARADDCAKEHVPWPVGVRINDHPSGIFANREAITQGEVSCPELKSMLTPQAVPIYGDRGAP